MMMCAAPKNRCPYGGTWPYCNEPALPVPPRVSGLGYAMPGAVAPSFRQGYDIVGTGPRRPPPPGGMRLFGLGAFTTEQRNTALVGIIGGALVGLGIGYWAWK